MQSVMYCNNVDSISDIVFVTFALSTQKGCMNTGNTQLLNTHTLLHASTQSLHIIPHFLHLSSIPLTKCIDILMLQINSHAKKWRFTS